MLYWMEAESESALSGCPNIIDATDLLLSRNTAQAHVEVRFG